MPHIMIHDVAYYYTISGAGSTTTQSPPLVLLHGFTGSSANWQPLQAAMAPARRCIAIDLLGHGQTDAPADPARYAMDQSARDVVDLLAAVTPGPVDLLGYSMGGRLALYLAARYPASVRRLVLESASPGLADSAARQARVQSDETLAASIEAEGMAAFVARWEKVSLFASQQRLPAATRRRLREQRLRNQEIGLASSLRGMGTGAQPALWRELPTLTVPTLVLTGALDQKFCEIGAEMVALLPDATHTTIPDAGHTIHLEQPSAFAHAVSTFLT